MIQEIIDLYQNTVLGIQQSAINQPQRASGGVQRSTKGRVVEDISKLMITQAWKNAGGSESRLQFGKTKFKVPIRKENIPLLPEAFKDKFNTNSDGVSYSVKVDTHVLIDGNFVMGVECKAYTENAMLKRILVDFHLLKTVNPQLICCLLQLETQLGGTNSDPSIHSPIANNSTYTLMTYFPKVKLNIMTLLEGYRHVDRPIHQKEHFKEMKPEYVEHAIDRLSNLLKSHV